MRRICGVSSCATRSRTDVRSLRCSSLSCICTTWAPNLSPRFLNTLLAERLAGPLPEVRDREVPEGARRGGQVAVAAPDDAERPPAVGSLQPEPGDRRLGGDPAGDGGQQPDPNPGADQAADGRGLLALARDRQ